MYFLLCWMISPCSSVRQGQCYIIFQVQHTVKSLSADFRFFFFFFAWLSYQFSVRVALCFLKEVEEVGEKVYFTTCQLRCVLMNRIWLTLHPLSSFPDLQSFEPCTWKKEVFIGICYDWKLCCSSEGIVCIPLHKIMNTGAVSCEPDQQSCPILVAEVIRVKCSSRETCAMVVFKGHACKA